MKEITVGNGQQLEDVAIVEYGDAVGCILICTDNNLSLDDTLFAGQKLKIRTPIPEINDNNIINQRQIASSGIVPNSGVFGIAPPVGYALEDYFAEDYNQN